MSKYLDGTSLFTSMNSGLTNTFGILANAFNGDVTLANLASKDANSAISSNGLNQNF